MRLFFVNVECEVINETREFTPQQSADKPYRTFVYAVVARNARDAIKAVAPASGINWREIKRYAQNPDGFAPGEAIFQGCTDHDRKLYSRAA